MDKSEDKSILDYSIFLTQQNCDPFAACQLISDATRMEYCSSSFQPYITRLYWHSSKHETKNRMDFFLV